MPGTNEGENEDSARCGTEKWHQTDIDIVDYLKNARKSDFSAQTFAYVIFLLYFCSVKSNEQQEFETMFGVKSSNQPITGKFAEEFIRNLLEAQKQPKQDVKGMTHVIICD